jgi:hypothetical protein
MSDVTRILGQFEYGDGEVAEKLLHLVCDEFRKLAAADQPSQEAAEMLAMTAWKDSGLP